MLGLINKIGQMCSVVLATCKKTLFIDCECLSFSLSSGLREKKEIEAHVSVPLES